MGNDLLFSALKCKATLQASVTSRMYVHCRSLPISCPLFNSKALGPLHQLGQLSFQASRYLADPSSKRIVFRRNLLTEVVAQHGDLLHDILAHSRYLSEEEKGSESCDGAEACSRQAEAVRPSDVDPVEVCPNAVSVLTDSVSSIA